MGAPRLRDVFRLNEGVNSQHWTSDGNRYNVGMLYDFAKASTDVEDVPLNALKYSFEHTNLDEERWSDEFVARAQEADLKYPILVVRDRKDKLWISDGNHRYGKAVMQSLEMIPAYVIDEKDLPVKAIEPDPNEKDGGSHKRVKSGGELT